MSVWWLIEHIKSHYKHVIRWLFWFKRKDTCIHRNSAHTDHTKHQHAIKTTLQWATASYISIDSRHYFLWIINILIMPRVNSNLISLPLSLLELEQWQESFFDIGTEYGFNFWCIYPPNNSIGIFKINRILYKFD